MDTWKMCILGDSGVGKTTLLELFTINCYFAVEEYDRTEEVSYRKQLLVDNRMCFLDIFDVNEKEEYPRTLMLSGQGFIIVYSVASRATFERVELFHQWTRRIRQGNFVFMLVGNKCDKSYEREVSKEEGAELGSQLGCAFIETSGKTAQNVERLFHDIVRSLRAAVVYVQDGAEPGTMRGKQKKRCIIM
ncbi:ras protein [Crassisporium funariophilum]|nr:ras protein [Crassisporium funariophilum]